MGERVAKALSPVPGVEDLLDSQLPGALAILAFFALVGRVGRASSSRAFEKPFPCPCSGCFRLRRERNARPTGTEMFRGS